MSTAKYKNKKFKLDLPTKINRQPKKNDLFFTFKFTQAQGVLTVMGGIQDAKAEFDPIVGGLSAHERIEQQAALLDDYRRLNF
jgi:hypothetical protein